MNILPEVKKVIDNIKNSNYFWVDLPKTMSVKYLKRMPFPVAIGTYNLFAHVLALNEDEAHEKMYDYLNSIDDCDIV